MPVSVIVTAGGTTADFQNLLSGLRPTLGLRDEVVCVLPPQRHDLAVKARTQRWLTVVDETPPEHAARWSAGLAATTNPVVVLLDGDTVLTPHWLEPIAAAFDDPTVVAAGPRCHRSLGPQRVRLPPEAAAGIPVFKAYARQWRQDHRGLTDVDRLGPVCVAVRREALERAGGPTLDMPYAELREQGRLVLVESALIAHLGGRQCALRPAPPADAPLLSASLIVKDEEAVIATCLNVLRAVADEIVVYDTGSTDRTREIAREMGARVIDGYWDDHFGDARNRSLAHCRGRWALTVDADEVVGGDPKALRQQLETAGRTLDAFLVHVDSPTGAGSVSVWSPRLFRAAEYRYSGRLHEQVTHRITGEVPQNERTETLSLAHSGYLGATVATKDKVRRNHRLAALAKSDGPEALYNFARAERDAGDPAGAIDACRSGLAANPEAFIRVGLLSILIRCCAETGRFPEANEALAELRTAAREQVTTDQSEIVVRTAEGNHERVLELLRGIPENAFNDLGVEAGRRRLRPFEIISLRATGRPAEAAELLRAELRAGRLVLPLGDIAKVLEGAGSDVAELARLIPEHAVREVLYATRPEAPPLAEAVVEALWERFPGDPQLFGVVVWLAGRLPVNSAIRWSGRMREQGLARYCPLLALAAATDRSARDRALAAAAALELFGDQAALPPLSEALALVPDDQSRAVLKELRALAPGVASAISSV
ncbi:glycosyltransferase [Amorphoplanes digitatis]|uniref:Tetratricopeptide (TPR) repeat protein n=1 Tax=Actinoplanes digitatis TaxID=1868 RepID=A0A7W7HS09_9ACTN|nr:glycosyltransferase [Actinoplanes digitatis]MBB4759674.1 tetratricopeptide (TPR) repeat protein [Actinoplanes digitatis]